MVYSFGARARWLPLYTADVSSCYTGEVPRHHPPPPHPLANSEPSAQLPRTSRCLLRFSTSQDRAHSRVCVEENLEPRIKRCCASSSNSTPRARSERVGFTCAGGVSVETPPPAHLLREMFVSRKPAVSADVAAAAQPCQLLLLWLPPPVQL